MELEKLIDKMMQQEFARFTAADLNRPIDEDSSIDEVNFLPPPPPPTSSRTHDPVLLEIHGFCWKLMDVSL